MNSRNSFLPHKPYHKPNINQSSNIDRATFNNYNSVTKNHKADKSEIQDKLITRIISFAHKFQKHNETRIISRQMLKNGSNKIFLDVMGIFLRSLDHKFERGDVNADLIMDILKAFGYPHNYNKTIFQPIGAPHTWGHCLSILQWFGQLADFTNNFEVEQQDQSFRTIQKNMLVLNSYNDKNTQPLTTYINQETNRIETEIEQYRFSIDSKKMAIANHQNAQRDLTSLEKEIEKQKELAYRIKQELCQLQSEEKSCDESIEMLRNEVEQNNAKLNQLTVQLSNIQYEIDHQQLLPEQCERLKLETMQTKNRILKLRQQIADRRNKFKTESGSILQKMIDKVSIINQLNIEIHQNKLLQNHQLEIPTVNLSELHNLLIQTQPKKESISMLQVDKIRKIMKKSQYSNYIQRQQNLLNTFQQQIQNQKQSFKNNQQVNSQLSNEHEYQKTKLRQIQRTLKLIQNRNADKQKQIILLQQEIKRMNNDSLALESQLCDLKAYKKKIIEETKTKVNQVKQINNQMEGLEEQFENIVKRSQISLQKHQQQCLNKLNKHKQLMAKMNQQLLLKYISVKSQFAQSQN